MDGIKLHIANMGKTDIGDNYYIGKANIFLNVRSCPELPLYKYI